MYSNFKEQAIKYVKQAVEEDNAGNYARAFPLYMNALEYFKTHLKYEKDPKIREAITQKFTEYLRRVEELRAVLDEGRSRASSAAVAVRPKDWEENSDIWEENLNITSIEQAREYLKQAVQEDNAGNCPKAYSIYINVLKYFMTYLKYEKSPTICEEIKQKFDEYIIRATDIRAALCEGGTADAPNFSDSEYLKIKVFREQAIEYVKQAVQEDQAGNYSKAFPLYMNALEYFKTYLKYEKYYKFRDAINKNFTKSLRHAEEIRAFLDGRAKEIRVLSDEDGASLNGGDDIIPGLAARPEISRFEDGEGSGGLGEEGCPMEIKLIISNEGGISGVPLNGGDDSVPGLAAESKVEDGERDGEENSKLRAGLNSPIVREKPSAKSTRTQRLCSCFSGNP